MTEYKVKEEIANAVENMTPEIIEILDLCYHMMKETIPRETLAGWLKNDFAAQVNQICYELDYLQENEDKIYSEK